MVRIPAARVVADALRAAFSEARHAVRAYFARVRTVQRFLRAAAAAIRAQLAAFERAWDRLDRERLRRAAADRQHRIAQIRFQQARAIAPRGAAAAARRRQALAVQAAAGAAAARRLERDIEASRERYYARFHPPPAPAERPVPPEARRRAVRACFARARAGFRAAYRAYAAAHRRWAQASRGAAAVRAMVAETHFALPPGGADCATAAEGDAAAARRERLLRGAFADPPAPPARVAPCREEMERMLWEAVAAAAEEEDGGC